MNTTNTQNQAFVPLQDVTSSSWIVNVRQNVGKGYVTLKSEKLAAPGLAQTLKDNGANSKFSLPVYQASVNGKMWGLYQAGAKLGNDFDFVLKKAQAVSAGRNAWFFPSRNKDVFDQGWADLKRTEQDLIQQLLSIYDSAKSLYSARLQAILTKADAMEDFYLYMAEFPTEDDIRNNFKLEMLGQPSPIPSLLEIAQATPEMRVYLSNLRDVFSKELPTTTGKLSKELALFFKRLSKFDPAEPGDKAQFLAESWESVRGYAELYDDQSSGAAPCPVRNLATIALDFTPSSPRFPSDKRGLQVKLDALKDGLIQQKWIQEPTSDNQELSEWVGVETLETKLKNLKKRISELAAIEDESERNQLLRQLQVESKTFSYILKGTADKLLSMVGMSLEAESEVEEGEGVDEERDAPTPP